MNIGWIGLGNMGSAMAARVLAAGHTLTVYNRTRDKAQALIERGARFAEPAEVAANSQLLVSMLADDRALRAVLEPGGALAALAPGSVHVSMSTIGHALALELAEAHAARGVGFVGAPVFGRPDAAAQGKLFILAAGGAAELERCQPLFALLSQKVFPLGAVPAHAHLAKILGNFMLISSVELLAEALNLARVSELDPRALLGALTGSVFSAPFYAAYGGMIAEQRFPAEPAFALPLARKDLELALAAAAAAPAPLPVGEAVRKRITDFMSTAGGENLDLSQLGTWQD
jgi:3-hydroxyisobutyrate dehydrogenase-like beta-hydroxyacid dehydrogenase